MRWQLAALLFLCACKTLPKTPDSVLTALSESHDGYLTGAPVAWASPLVLNREDFVYDAKLSPDGSLAAVSRLGMKSFHLAIHELSKGGPSRSDTAINALEFDVDSLEFSPDGQSVATVSRDGALRLYSAAKGELLSAWLTEEPLVSVAWHPSGALLAIGSAKGLITLLSVPQMQHVAELRPHTDEVRALAFTPAGALVSGSWDRRLLTFEVVDSLLPPREVRTHVTRKNGLALFRAVLDRAASATVALDARLPVFVIKGALAQAVGIDVLKLSDTISVPTAFGTQLARVAKGRVLSVKNLSLDQVDVAVCDACVPADAQAVLGGPLLQRLSTAFDDTSGELVLTLNENATGVSLGAPRALQLAHEATFPAAVNDFSLDASGTIAGVAFSETKSERTKAVYDREKKGEREPEREWDCGARVELSTGKVLEKAHGHRGVVATVGISPDGKTLVTGGWDKQVIVHAQTPLVDDRFGWAVRRVRFSRDGRRVIAAAWTPQNPLNNHQSDPSALVYELLYPEAGVVGR